ncbi:O-antigen ligase family protein [Litoribaculum gwangyangense]|uniref:O-antigen ligase-related domain-containing protein n=1 Tax=Litoribaculum gwangyangense TaxID=1130722 RepID=A0ABP9C3I9_9FLAO
MKKLNKNIAFYLLSIICFIVFGYLIFYQFSVVNVFLSILLIPLFIIIRAPSLKAKKIFTTFVLAIITFLITINLNFPTNKVAVKYVIPAVNLVKKVFTGNHYKSVDERYEINIANKDLIKDAFLFGYGIGDVQNELNNYYYQHISDSKSYLIAYEKKLNTHNNYAFFILCGGVVLLILFLMSLVFSIYKGVLHKDWIYIFFLIIISVNLMFENMLSRIHGVLFYAIFNGFFIAKMINKNNQD